MPTMQIVARLSRELQAPQCPHCGKPVEVLEPAEVDALGLPWIKRKVLNKTGELRPWLDLRNGKYWLYLKRDVDQYLRFSGIERARRDLRVRAPGVDVETLSDEAVVELQKQIEATIRRTLRRQGIEDSEQAEADEAGHSE